METVRFGRYPRQKDGAAEPIDWIVIRTEKDEALLLSKAVLASGQYGTNAAQSSWESSALYTWLNGAFADAAFTGEEKAALITEINENAMPESVRLMQEEEYQKIRRELKPLLEGFTPNAENRLAFGGWWLMNAGERAGTARYVRADNNKADTLETAAICGIRPVIRIRLK